MTWADAPDAWLGRVIFERGVAALLLVTLLSTLLQYRALLSSTGLLPIPRFLRATRFADRPSVFGLYFSDRFFLTVVWVGMGLAVLTVAGVTASLAWWGHLLVWTGMWLIYLSIVNVGQRWYGFLWEMLLCEVLFIGIFIGPASQMPSYMVIGALIWLLFRVEFGAGMIKMRGDAAWRNLTALDYHHETQPMPGPLSWHFHHLPKALHRVETGANHVVQLVVPFLLIAPQPVRSWAGIAIALTQAWLVLSGNFAWINFLTIALALSLVDASLLGVVLPLPPPDLQPIPPAAQGILIAFGLASVVLAWWPLRNLMSARQRMNARYNPLLIGNAYGAFGSIGRVRKEIVIEGCDDLQTADWREYEWYGKPGDVRHRPPQVAPYHLRLGWLMWFAALSPAYGQGWLDGLLVRLLRGDRAVLRLARVNPFPDVPPRWVRVVGYDYRFTTRAERRKTGAWWVRDRRRPVEPARRLPTY